MGRVCKSCQSIEKHITIKHVFSNNMKMCDDKQNSNKSRTHEKTKSMGHNMKTKMISTKVEQAMINKTQVKHNPNITL